MDGQLNVGMGKEVIEGQINKLVNIYVSLILKFILLGVYIILVKLKCFYKFFCYVNRKNYYRDGFLSIEELRL